MVKLFKLRISRVIPSFQSCRSKDPSILPVDPVPPFLPLSPNPITLDFPPATPPPSKPSTSSFKRCISSVFISVGCGLGPKSRPPNSDDDHRCKSPEFKWQKEEKWHVVAKVHDDTRRQKIYNSSVFGDSEDDLFSPPPPPPPPPTAEKKKRRSGKKKMPATATRLRFSTSSAESGLFSSDGGDERDEEETETLVSSSRSFSTATESSSEFNPHLQLQTISETSIIPRRHKKKKKKQKRAKRGDVVSKVKIMRRPPESSPPEIGSPARLSVFKKLMIPCGVVDGNKVEESFAVVKNSEDPYGDFKGSMMEMILEKQMFEDRDLEELLQCFLSLNSRRHHRVIVEAFAEIWKAMFSSTISTHRRSSRAP